MYISGKPLDLRSTTAPLLRVSTYIKTLETVTHTMSYANAPGAPGQPEPPPYQSVVYPGSAPHHEDYPPEKVPPSSDFPAAAQAGPSGSAGAGGSFEGVQFRIDHRDTNTVLYIRLQPGYEFKARPGAMVAMDPSVQIQGNLTFSMKKLFTGGQLAQSRFTGPGEVLLAPQVWGDIIPIPLDGRTRWHFGKHAWLASTRDITLDTKAQNSVGKALFSGRGLFVMTASGAGMIFVQAMGSIITRTLADGEQWIVENDHLVAWTAKYNIEFIQTGSFLSSVKTDQGFVCRFTGPGTVYIQTRNPEAFSKWVAERAGLA
ncbi:hypothetical protein CERSUDRAFT_94566 [Gelatoporia subvermispora B]|uniref:Altered inheritance of mitochondria protein 24, mitochondrial n=1 Tax=Ceriporiopsis subvermispora (strain B) TaxID=914234 RepID=M2PMF1_CERS8|nr:hypothetical protein CERSUDRAFT_94566 [Gelatoporia subvermispora B]